jgi:hypothetical protein
MHHHSIKVYGRSAVPTMASAVCGSSEVARLSTWRFHHANSLRLPWYVKAIDKQPQMVYMSNK